jgi:hypothetical protein
MLYAFPILILAMLGYMFWHAGVSMRRDRIVQQKLSRSLASVRVRSRPRT